MIAMSKWAQELRRQGKEQESFELREALWRQGDVSAAVSLSIHYRDEMSSLAGDQDYVRAYAFTLIWNKVYEAASVSSASPKRASRLDADDSALRAIGAYLTPQQQEEAESLAVQLLAENTNCCIGRWH